MANGVAGRVPATGCAWSGCGVKQSSVGESAGAFRGPPWFGLPWWATLLVSGRSLITLADPAKLGDVMIMRVAGRERAVSVKVIGVEDWGDAVAPAHRYAIDLRLIEPVARRPMA